MDLKNAKPEKKENWDTDILELEIFFKDAKLPKPPIVLNNFTTMIDPDLFVKAHLEIVNANNGKPVFKPYLDRLKEFKFILQQNLSHG